MYEENIVFFFISAAACVQQAVFANSLVNIQRPAVTIQNKAQEKKIHVNPFCFDHGSPCCKSVIKKRLLSRLAKKLPPCDNMNPGEKAWVYWNNDPACHACCQCMTVDCIHLLYSSNWNCQKLAAEQLL
jgi:hypothetical protein